MVTSQTSSHQINKDSRSFQSARQIRHRAFYRYGSPQPQIQYVTSHLYAYFLFAKHTEVTPIFWIAARTLGWK